MEEAVVLYPAPGMGHVLSMVELGKLLLQHRRRSGSDNHFSITILLTTGLLDTPAVTSYIDTVSQAFPSISFRRLPSISVDMSQKCSRAALAFQFIRLHAPNVFHSLQEISKSHKIRAFVIDLFCTSALSIGKDLKIPTFYLYTSGASALAAFLQFPKLDEQTTGSFKDQPETVFHFRGVPPLKATHMPEPTLDREDPAYHDFVVYFCSGLAKSDGIIVNSFEDLEPIAIKAIADGICLVDAPTPPTYYIGPLIASADSQANQHECLSWLDKQPSKSVVFLCFGSRGTFPATQVMEIANGLERSGQRFLWVVKNPPQDEKGKQTVDTSSDVDLDSLLPEGFIERTKDRGLVVKSFAPQVAVLNKDAVGGFVTHCGWNSILETVVAGVPMITWPLYAEQHLNRNILVEDMKLAIPVEQRDEEGGFVSGEEVEKRVRELMESDGWKELRERSRQMREKALAAWGPSGSSATALTKLVELWVTVNHMD